MLFNSYIFIFLFLPIVLIGYFSLNKYKLVYASKAWLVLSSLFFYSYWNIKYLPLILISVIVNYAFGTNLAKIKKHKKVLLITGIVFNLSFLGYFKYYDFFISNLNWLLRTDFNLLHLLLPLGISFFTFQQIAYLVDSYKKETTEYDFLNYAIFVTFFPQLIAGPIVHHKEMMPQFAKLKNKVLNYKNLSLGIFIFLIGLCKKVVIADTFAAYANAGFDVLQSLNFFEAWVTSLSYTIQLYFDFSGYCDMAIGIGLMFNIKLPINFNSPYKSKNIQEFWKRWHMTLGRFLTDYLYIPLGGSRNGKLKTYRNLFIVFFLSGLWHGAGWTFIVWGILHAAAVMIHKFWKDLGKKMHPILAGFIMFNFINITWIFFRAKTFTDVKKVLLGMFDFTTITISDKIMAFLPFLENLGIRSEHNWLKGVGRAGKTGMLQIIILLIICFSFKNSVEQLEKFKPNKRYLIVSCILFILAITSQNKVSAFLYFNF